MCTLYRCSSTVKLKEFVTARVDNDVGNITHCMLLPLPLVFPIASNIYLQWHTHVSTCILRVCLYYVMSADMDVYSLHSSPFRLQVFAFCEN